MTNREGTTLALPGYTDLERIGHGGLGDVYRATRTSTGGTVAIKVLRDVSDESVAWHRTRRELTALVSLGGHAHVIALVELLETTPGLVMEYAPGGSVAQLLDRRGTTLTVSEVVLVGRQTAAALAAAHELGIVHRDVKPQNLLIDAFGQVKLCDFGIASLARTEEFRTRTSAISMRYASPEDLEDEAEVGPAADVYSLGATLLHLAYGAPPTLKERLAPWRPPETDGPSLAALGTILADCLQPEPASRPTADELRERLDQLDWELPDRRRSLDVEVATPTKPEPTVQTAVASVDESAERAEDATVYRTGRERPTVPERPGPSTLRSWPPPITGRVVVAAVVVGLVVVVTVAVFVTIVLLGSGNADAPAPRSTPVTTTTVAPSRVEIVERPNGLVRLDDPAVAWPLGAIGECLVQLPGVDILQPVDCDEPHDLERFAVGALDETTTSSDDPDEAEIELAVADLCLDAAPSATIPSLTIPGLRVAQTNPSAATWRDGDRGYQCLLGVPDARLVGSALD